MFCDFLKARDCVRK